jgi:hypothetical protein
MWTLMRDYLLGKSASKYIFDKIFKSEPSQLQFHPVEENIAELIDIHLVVDANHLLIIIPFDTS